MVRIRSILAFVLLAFPALAEKAPTILRGNMPSLSQGRAGAQRFAPAPMPNPDMLAPITQRDTNAIQLSPGLTRTPTGQAHRGDGFANGTAYTGELEKRRGGLGSNVVPSLNLRMPMQVEFR